jgi:hypothetical protein
MELFKLKASKFKEIINFLEILRSGPKFFPKFLDSKREGPLENAKK